MTKLLYTCLNYMCIALGGGLKVSEQFRDAEALAEFANLNSTDSAEVGYFRNNYPDFAPAEWWEYKYEGMEIVPAVMPWGDSPINPAEQGALIDDSPVLCWTDLQDEIVRKWEDHFQFESVFNLTALLKMVFIVPGQTKEERMETVWTQSHLYLPDGSLAELASPTLYTFHTAVLYLYQQPWRARICKSCGKYFVANHPKRDFCEYPDKRGETCRQKNDNARHLVYYRETGKKKRQVKMRKNRSRRADRESLRQR